MKSSTLRAALVLLLTFAAGAAAGVAADRMLLDGRPDGTRHERKDRTEDARDREDDRDDDRPRTTIERFADELGLTAAQRARIEEILSGHRQAMREMWSEIRPRFRTLVDSARSDIEAVLTEEQVEQYRRYLRKEHGDRDSIGPDTMGGDPDEGEERGEERGR